MTDEEKAIDVPARQAKLAQILNGAQFDDVGKIAATVPMQISGPLPPVPRKRKTRSDAGKPKPRKPEPAQAGILSAEQWARLGVLNNMLIQSECDLQRAQERCTRARGEFHDYLDSLKAQA